MGVNALSRVALTLALATPFAVAAMPAPASAAAGCGGTLAFGEIAVCASISGGRQDAFTITTTRNNDMLFTKLTRGSGEFPGARVTAPNGTQVCFFSVDSSTCQLGRAATYTITVSVNFGGTGNYTLSVQSQKTPSVCTTLANSFFSFADTGFQSDLPLGSSGDCFRFNQPVGSVFYLWSPGATNAGDVQGQIVDAQFQPVCFVRYATTCTLTTAGPYRLQIFEYYGNPVSYTLRMSRISKATGCAPLKLARFGDPGDATGTGSLPYRAIGCHRIHLPSAGNVGIRIYNGQQIYWYVYDDAGQLVCQKGFDGPSSCRLPAEGDYALIVLNQNFGPVDYQIAAPALFRNAGCAGGTGLSWAQDALVAHQISPVQTNCQPFQGNAGDRVMVYRAPVVYNSVASWLVDSTGQPLCTSFSNEDGCVLPATGQYRVISYLGNWDPQLPDATYKMQVRRLSQPAGCPVIRPGAYDAAPAGALGPIRCRILNISTPGAYIAKAFDEHNNQTFATLYDTAGLKVCSDSSGCNVPAPGRYTMVLAGGAADGVIDNDFSYVTTLLPWQPSGCATVPDTGYLDAPPHAAFTSAGQYLCRQLPSPTGARIVTFQPTEAEGSTRPNVYVLDSAGNYVCDTYGLRQYSCQLTGTAPYFAVFSEPGFSDPAAFTMAFARMDNAPACPVLPRDTNGSTVSTGGDRFVACFSIPADQHAAAESLTWRRLSGDGEASMSVFDETGSRYCQIFPKQEFTFTCYVPAGPLTVILETGSAQATYQITHRDGTTP